MKKASKLIVFGDGGSRGNPGEAAYGFAIFDDNNDLIFQEGKRLGIASNNVAEYEAVINALKWITESRVEVEHVEFYLDSLLVASQMSGKFKIKHPDMRKQFIKAKEYEAKLKRVDYFQVPRAENKVADRLVNDALDDLI